MIPEEVSVLKSARERLVEHVREGAGLPTKKQASTAVDAMLKFIQSEVAAGTGEVSLMGFGRFFKKTRPERTYRVPGKPGESRVSPKHDVVVFRPHSGFQSAVNGGEPG